MDLNEVEQIFGISYSKKFKMLTSKTFCRTAKKISHDVRFTIFRIVLNIVTKIQINVFGISILGQN
jgi:hypothetical protein